MKTLFICNLLIFMMNDIPLDLLGQHISDVPEAYTWSNEKPADGEIYMIDVLDDFLGKPYQKVFIATDSDGLIQNFTIYVDEIVNQSFFDLMVEEYGKPNSMFKEGDIISQEKTTVKNDFLELQGATVSSIEECTFEESPRYIVWRKEGYDIEVIIGHHLDTFTKTKILFGKGSLNALGE
ncbi:hypothetical protein [Aquimarina aggregata]|uniref:hypothetical protein n=1 Tax=Aquimarina aggregata TaxID=1642818 RepID=UPI0024912AA4|nr:hypothetical protein [Aquimarina aggregata]